MKVIKIFIASSITIFSKERKRIAAYFCDLNNILVEKGVFCDVKFCEELDNAVPESRKQDEYNEFITNSDIVLFLVNSDCGEYTFEEFNTALCSEKHPRIVVFAQNSVNEATAKVLFMKRKAEIGEVRFVPYDEYYEIEDRIIESVREVIESTDMSGFQLENDRLRKVTFFLGTSGIENEDEKNEILRFVLGLNEKLLGQKIYVQIVPCTEKVSGIEISDLLAAHERLITNSEVAFFVFFSKVDNVSERDLLVAVNRFRETGSPKIYTYFLEQSDDDDSVLCMKKYIDQTLNHYYSIFSSVDSIKLSMLLHLSERNAFSLSVENRTIISHGSELLNVNELSIFAHNEALNQLKCRLDDFTNQYDAVAEEFAGDHNRRDLIRVLSDLDDAIGVLRERIRREENEALSMLYEMHRNVAKGEMNELMKKAYRLLEKGMIDKAAEILNKETVDSYYGDRLSAQVRAVRSEADDAIQMYRHTIHIQKMLGESESTVSTIIACYETIMEYIAIANPETYTVVLEYAQYLDQQNSPKAEQVFIKTEFLLANPEQNTNSEVLAQLYSSMGEYYLKQHNTELSEKYLKKYFEIAENLYIRDKEKYALLYAQSCLKYAQNDIRKKTDVIELGLTVMQQMYNAANCIGTNPYVTNMAQYYYGRGNFYGAMGDSPKALESYKQAAELLEIHHIENGLLADIYNNIAEEIRKYDADGTREQTVRRYYDKALDLLETLYATAPETYAEALGDVYNNKFMYFIDYGERNYQGLQCLKACEDVYLYWYQKNPRKNGQGLAECCIQMSYVYDSLGNKKRAIQYAYKGIELLEGLSEINYDRYAIKLAWAYSELGLLYILYEQDVLARDCLCKSLDILEKSDSHYIQLRQSEVIEKLWLAVDTMIKRGKPDSDDLVYELSDRVFRFFYSYVKPSFGHNNSELIRELYSLGEKLLYHFDSLDHEKTMQFYYPAVKELGDLMLLDPSVPEEEKVFININLAAVTGLSGDIEKGESYMQAHLDSLKKQTIPRSSNTVHNKKNSRKKRRKKR